MNDHDPKPDIQRIEEIVTSVKNGYVRLPRFQRPFVWKRKEVLKLLDSIYKGYPIGSILLWNTSEKLVSERAIADLNISADNVYYPTNYILDGQQRLSSLCGALYWQGSKPDSIWNVAFDLDKEEFLHPGDEIKIEYFPLNRLLNTSDFINQCKAFDAHNKKEKLFKNAEKLLRSIKDYKIAVVKIGDMTISEVGPIFERINSTGRKLTIVDLMRAATWKGGFDLNDAIDVVKNVCESLDYNDIPENHILRNISACAGLGINREDIDKLRSKSSFELQSASQRCSNAYFKAINFLKSNLPLPTYAYLPYGLQLTFLVEFFNIQPYPSPMQENELIKWFWKTALSRYFGTSNTGQNARDLEYIRQFANEKILEIPVEREISVERFTNDDFRLNLANSKTFAIVLANNKPYSITTGELLETEKILSVVNRLEFHHVVPIQLYPEYDLNICNNVILLNKRDNAYFSNFRPSAILADLVRDNDERIYPIFESNFIDRECISALLEDDIKRFLHARKELFKVEIERLTGVNTSFSLVSKTLPEDEYEDI